MRTSNLMTLIKTIARMREEYHFDDDKTFVGIGDDVLTRLPKLVIHYYEESTGTEVTLERVMRSDDAID